MQIAPSDSERLSRFSLNSRYPHYSRINGKYDERSRGIKRVIHASVVTFKGIRGDDAAAETASKWQKSTSPPPSYRKLSYHMETKGESLNRTRRRRRSDVTGSCRRLCITGGFLLFFDPLQSRRRLSDFSLSARVDRRSLSLSACIRITYLPPSLLVRSPLPTSRRRSYLPPAVSPLFLPSLPAMLSGA